MKPSLPFLTLLVGTLILAGACASSTKVVSSWKAPGVVRVQPKRVLVVVPTHDGALRRNAEDQLVRRIRVPSVASHEFVPDGDLATLREYEDEIVRRGFDTIVVFRPVSVSQEQTWVPGTYAGPSYAFGGWPMYDPGYVETDTRVRIDTNVYSVPDRELIWAGTTESLDPSSVPDLVDDVADAVAKKMREDGVI